LAGVGDEEVEGAFGEKELVSGMVYFLSAEVPEVNAEGVAARMLEVKTEYINPFSGWFGGSAAFEFEDVVGVNQFVGKASFSGSAFTNYEELSFVIVIRILF
jgi:hypothetical protein